MADFEVEAAPRMELGKGAMRRLRREGLVPAVLYGAGKDVQALTVGARALRKQLENEAFFSRILSVKVDGQADEQVVVKDLQRHPATSEVLHLDLLRISATQKITMTVPLHFENEQHAPGARLGGVFAHHVAEAEISCLPKDLPEYIEVDLGALDLGDSVHLSDLIAPAGVELVALAHDNDLVVASLALPRTVEEEDEALEGEEGEEDIAAAAPAEDEAGGDGEE